MTAPATQSTSRRCSPLRKPGTVSARLPSTVIAGISRSTRGRLHRRLRTGTRPRRGGTGSSPARALAFRDAEHPAHLAR